MRGSSEPFTFKMEINLIPLFIEAPTKKDLVRLMFMNNVKFGKKFNYFDIQKDGTAWVAWYFDKVERVEVLNAL